MLYNVKVYDKPEDIGSTYNGITFNDLKFDDVVEIIRFCLNNGKAVSAVVNIRDQEKPAPTASEDTANEAVCEACEACGSPEKDYCDI